MFIDSHCHLADEVFVPDLASVVSRAKADGLAGAMCILDATNETEWKRYEDVKSLWGSVVCATGIHPHHAGKFNDRLESINSLVRSLLDSGCAVRALGEVGLDYHYDFAPKELQQEVFRRQVALARQLNLPLVIHTREADIDTVEILRDEGNGEVTGVFHCFTGDVKLAEQALDLGFYISFSGIVTFRKANNVREAAKFVPANRMLIETDAPYLAPIPYRGKRNEPAWVQRVAEVLSEIRSETIQEISTHTSAAFTSLFGELE